MIGQGVTIPFLEEPNWVHPKGHPVFVFRTANALLGSDPFVLRYGDEGAKVFPSREAACRYGKKHWDKLARGLNPETGEPK